MNIEGLLKPRFKQIADFPNCYRHTGYIYVCEDEEDINFFTKYPAIYKKLEWFEDREEKDMPEYVKSRLNTDFIEKVTSFQLDALGVLLDTHVISLDVRLFIPATKKEYLNRTIR